jgi:hypothetical protein
MTPFNVLLLLIKLLLLILVAVFGYGMLRFERHEFPLSIMLIIVLMLGILCIGLVFVPR